MYFRHNTVFLSSPENILELPDLCLTHNSYSPAKKGVKPGSARDVGVQMPSEDIFVEKCHFGCVTGGPELSPRNNYILCYFGNDLINSI